MQTIVAPVVTTLLFLAIFLLALSGQQRASSATCRSCEFLAPGLIMMAMAQNAFANTTSSLHDRQDAGQHRRPADAAAERRRADPGLRARRRDARRWWSALVVTAAMAIFVPHRTSHDPPALVSSTPSRHRCCCRCSASSAASGPTSSTTSRRSPISSSCRCPSCRARSIRSSACRTLWQLIAPSQPVLLHDRRLPLRLHRPRRRAALARHRASWSARQCRAAHAVPSA